MYGINLISVGKLLATVATSNALFSKNGAVKSIYQEIIKYSSEKNIEMVKLMMMTLARQNEKAYNEMIKILHDNFSDEELKEIIPE